MIAITQFSPKWFCNDYIQSSQNGNSILSCKAIRIDLYRCYIAILLYLLIFIIIIIIITISIIII